MADFDPDKHCGAQRANQPPGVLCTRPKGWGTSHSGIGHCKRHGGSTESQTKAAQQEMAAQAVAAYGIPADTDPHSALLDEVRRTAGHVAALQLIVGELERDQLTYGTAREVTLPDGKTQVTAQAAFNVWVQLYLSERKHLVVACRTAITCGVEERRVELEERRGQLIADVFRRVFDDESLELSEKQRKAALVSAARHLRVIEGGKAA